VEVVVESGCFIYMSYTVAKRKRKEREREREQEK
jgi:hypothetical protein